jgi:hypothetical protein
MLVALFKKIPLTAMLYMLGGERAFCSQFCKVYSPFDCLFNLAE